MKILVLAAGWAGLMTLCWLLAVATIFT